MSFQGTSVDKERYLQEMTSSVRKYLTDNKHLEIVMSNHQPIFSSIEEMESGLVSSVKSVVLQM